MVAILKGKPILGLMGVFVPRDAIGEHPEPVIMRATRSASL
jgi:hypothetical protein